MSVALCLGILFFGAVLYFPIQAILVYERFLHYPSAVCDYSPSVAHFAYKGSHVTAKTYAYRTYDAYLGQGPSRIVDVLYPADEWIVPQKSEFQLMRWVRDSQRLGARSCILSLPWNSSQTEIRAWHSNPISSDDRAYCFIGIFVLVVTIVVLCCLQYKIGVDWIKTQRNQQEGGHPHVVIHLPPQQ